MKRLILMLVIAATVAVQLRAQEPVCKQNEARQDCFVRFGKEWARKTNAASGVQSEVAAANTGIPNAVSPAQSAAKDFLSRFAAALLMPMDGSNSMPLSLGLNVPLAVASEPRLQLQAVFTRPQPSADTKQRLSANATAMMAVNDSLSEFDDVTVSAALDPSTLRLGRSITPHRDAYQKLLDARFQEQAAAIGQQDDVRLKADALIGEFGGKFAMLLNNQPQFYGTVLYRARKNVAGPSERSARVTYEMGFRNLNRFYGSRPDCLRLTDANAGGCAQALDDFAGKTIVTDSADRVALSVEYRTSGGLRVVLPEYKVDFTTSSARSFVYSIAYGRNNMVTANGRIDLAVNYEDTTVGKTTDLIPAAAVADPPKAVRDRLVASATYTYKINDRMAMPLSLTYANHAAYLGDVDRRLNAHIGLTFKVR